jgi:leader peptidase (prepilin peptidase)/N-methyltransferase
VLAVPEVSGAAWVAMAGLLGLLVGSFLNVVIHRLPKMLERRWREQSAEFSADGTAPAVPTSPASPYNLVTPRSACPACQAPISAWQNIPIVSYLVLRGRCASCGVRISLRYPLIEGLCGLLTATVAWKFGVGWPALAAAIVTWFLIALAGIDLDHQLLPDDLTLPLLWGGLLASLFWTPAGTTSLPVSPVQAIVGAVAGYGSLWAVFHLFRLCTGKEGMGYGDFKLLAALGAWLGGRMLLPIVLGSATVGAIVGIALILSGQRGRGTPLPFGPFLAAAGWLAMMWGPEWVNAYIGLYGRV